ncbi:lipopolysaccharide assembly protein LapB [Paucisalibacillus sp. EB02]|uniref:tetratricopeptide repeat protein n=1 Tax=Paucisalibacillus sp. EB02 TaxID=1347087 RepID=UPI0004B3679A|nr:tetratricopeptide repeat protein [Paucisalibacillus sp. EB02]
MTVLEEANKLMEMDQVDQAIDHISSHLEHATDDERFGFAEFYMNWGFLLEAEDILLHLLKQYPDESELKLLLTDIYIEQQMDEKAIDLLNSIPSDDEAYLQALVALADLYQSQGLFEVAEQKLQFAKEISPTEPIIDLALGELYYSLGDFKRAITFYEKSLKIEAPDIPIHERLAESYLNVGEFELALNFYEKTNSKNPDTLFKYGFTAFEADRNDIAINVWNELIEEDPYYHTAYIQLAKAYEEDERIQEAYETALKGIKMDEFNKELYFLAGSLAHQVGLEEETEKYMREAVNLDADYKEAVLFLIEILKEKDRQDDIIELIKVVKETGGEDPLYDWELARAYNEIESYNDALNHYQEAYNSLQHDNDFLKEFGYFLMEEGRTGEAIKIFTAYLQDDPQDDEIVDYVNRLRQM